MKTSPEVGGASPPRMLKRVDLPDPDGPTAERNSPRRTFRSTPRNACTSTAPARKVLVNPRMTMMESDAGLVFGIALLIGERLNRILPGRFETRINGAQESASKGDGAGDGPPIGRIHNRERGRHQFRDDSARDERKKDAQNATDNCEQNSFTNQDVQDGDWFCTEGLQYPYLA